MIAVSSSRLFPSSAYYYIMAFVKKMLRLRFYAQNRLRIQDILKYVF